MPGTGGASGEAVSGRSCTPQGTLKQTPIRRFQARIPARRFQPQIPARVSDGVPGAARGYSLRSAASLGGAEPFLYPGDRHLFADRRLPYYDANAAAALQERVLGFLDAIG